MSGNITYGALARIFQGEDVSDPILQVLGHKPIDGSGQERYRLMLSDGHYYSSFSMLATLLNNLIHDKQLEPFTFIKVKKHICNSVPGQRKRVVVILELEIVTPGSQIGSKIGNPQPIGADGNVPPPSGNQITNPNARATSQKRPAPTTNSSDNGESAAINKLLDLLDDKKTKMSRKEQQISQLVIEKNQLGDEISQLESILEDLIKKNAKNEETERNLPIPECPVCMEQMMPPTRIIQCMSGHLVCQTCESQPTLVNCPTCRQNFTGRAIGMEQFIASLMNEN